MKTRDASKKTISYKIVFIIVFIIFVAYALSLIFPIFWLLMSSVKDVEEFDAAFYFLPQKIVFENFKTALDTISAGGNNSSFLQMTFNSLWFAFGGTFLGLATATCFSYVVSKYRFFGRRILYTIAIVVMMIPIVGAFPSQYKLYDTLHLLNSPLILISFASGFGMNFLVMTATFDSLSWSYAEASFMDGASHFKVFIRVMLPQVLAPFAALFIIDFIGIWNDYMSPYLFMPNLPTLSTGLYLYEDTFNTNMDSMSFPIYFCGVVLCMIPALVLFLIFQNTIMEMSVSGGVKE